MGDLITILAANVTFYADPDEMQYHSDFQTICSKFIPLSLSIYLLLLELFCALFSERLIQDYT